MPLRLINPNLHVILIHYPLGVFVLGVVLELFSFLWRRSPVRIAAKLMIILGALLSLPAATSGIYALYDVRRNQHLTDAAYHMLRWHVILMGSASILAVACAVIGLGSSNEGRRKLYFPLLLGVVAAWGLMVVGAWHGGETIYQNGTSVAIIKNKLVETKWVVHTSDGNDTNVAFIDAQTVDDAITEINKAGGSSFSAMAAARPGRIKVTDKTSGKDGFTVTDVTLPDPNVIGTGPDTGVDKSVTVGFDQRRPVQVPLHEEPHNPRNYEDVRDYYMGGELQQHLVMAGLAFAAIFGALGLSMRRLNAPVVALVPLSVGNGGEPRRQTSDINVVQSISPRTEIGLAEERVPSGRFWLLAALVIIATAGIGYWLIAGQDIFKHSGWDTFRASLQSEDSAVKISRYAAHLFLGGALLVLALIFAIVAMAAPRNSMVLTVFGFLLLLVISGQVWIGVLMTFDRGGTSLVSFDKGKIKDRRPETAPSDATPVTPATLPTTISPPTVPDTTVPPTTVPSATTLPAIVPPPIGSPKPDVPATVPTSTPTSDTPVPTKPDAPVVSPKPEVPVTTKPDAPMPAKSETPTPPTAPDSKPVVPSDPPTSPKPDSSSPKPDAPNATSTTPSKPDASNTPSTTPSDPKPASSDSSAKPDSSTAKPDSASPSTPAPSDNKSTSTDSQGSPKSDHPVTKPDASGNPAPTDKPASSDSSSTPKPDAPATKSDAPVTETKPAATDAPKSDSSTTPTPGEGKPGNSSDSPASSKPDSSAPATNTDASKPGSSQSTDGK